MGARDLGTREGELEGILLALPAGDDWNRPEALRRGSQLPPEGIDPCEQLVEPRHMRFGRPGVEGVGQGLLNVIPATEVEQGLGSVVHEEGAVDMPRESGRGRELQTPPGKLGSLFVMAEHLVAV